MKEIVKRTVREHASALRGGEYSARELCEAYLEKIEREDAALSAFLTVAREKALLFAEKADLLLKNGEGGALCGIPYGVKDNICTEGIATTAASKMLSDFVPTYSATAVERLCTSGAVMLGKTNMDEFAMGSSCESSAFKITRNPYDLTRSPGGSSGGSAAAVGASLAPFCLGSDTGGSVRCPAAFCSCVGLKPTYGTVSRNGLIAFSPSLEQIGPVTKDVFDNALVYSAIMGRDNKDATSRNGCPDLFSKMEEGAKGLRIGFSEELFSGDLDPEVKSATLAALRALEKEGAEIVPVSLPSAKYATAAYYIISSAEASSCLARYDGVRFGHRTEKKCESIEELFKKSRSEGFGKEVKRRITLGTYVLSEGYFDEFYNKALNAKRLVKGELRKAFEACDIILSPVSPVLPPKIGEKRDPVSVYLEDRFCVLANISGIPAISVPAKRGEGALPVGIQLMAPEFCEDILYRAARALEVSYGAY